MRHELDREDVLSVAGGDRRSQLELLALIRGLIAVDVEVLVVRAGGQKSAGFRPAQSVHATRVAVQLVDDVEVGDERWVAVELPI